jgi:hypothetical protein
MEWINAKEKLPQYNRQRVLICHMYFIRTATFLQLYSDESKEIKDVFVTPDKLFYSTENTNNLYWLPLEALPTLPE